MLTNLQMRLEKIGFLPKKMVPQGAQGVTQNKLIALRCSHSTDIDGTCFTQGKHEPFHPNPTTSLSLEQTLKFTPQSFIWYHALLIHFHEHQNLTYHFRTNCCRLISHSSFFAHILYLNHPSNGKGLHMSQGAIRPACIPVSVA